MNYTTVSIIVQARSTSKRFPGKIFERIGGKQILQHVLDACYNSASYINKFTNRHRTMCAVALAVPAGDAIVSAYPGHNIFQGSEDDVLGRYAQAAKALNADYIVRITADCPFIPPFIISKAIGWAVQDNLDFLTNADPDIRTSPDGHDVEIISAKLLYWLDENIKDLNHREHVTSFLHKGLPAWAKRADIIGFADLTGVKLSVDTPEDLERLQGMNQKIFSAIKKSPKSYRL
jgi:spore coat polysaccharide biosynthesis protein SpsF (cytidylyltransferase family)